MIFRDSGKVANGFYALGHSATPSYLLDCAHPILFDAGFSCLGPAYASEAKGILGNRTPAMLLLTHVHFDHCGAASYLKDAFEGLAIGASRRASEIVLRPGAQKLIAQLNRNAAEVIRSWNGQLHPDIRLDEPFRPFEVDRVLKDGDRIPLGDDLTVQVLATPGHTWDFLSYYIPERKILIASEAVGCMDMAGYIVTEFLVDYRVYMESLRRLASLDVEILCQGHRLVFLGDDVPAYFAESIRSAKEFKEWVDGLLDEEQGDVRKVMIRVKATEYDPRPFPKQPEAAYLLNLEARVRHLAEKRLGAADAAKGIDPASTSPVS